MKTLILLLALFLISCEKETTEKEIVKEPDVIEKPKPDPHKALIGKLIGKYTWRPTKDYFFYARFDSFYCHYKRNYCLACKEDSGKYTVVGDTTEFKLTVDFGWTDPQVFYSCKFDKFGSILSTPLTATEKEPNLIRQN